MKHAIVTMSAALAFMLHPPAARAEDQADQSAEQAGPEVESKLPIGPILLGSFGLVTVAVGGGFAWQAYEENEDYNTELDGRYPLATNKLADDIKTHAIVADVLMIGGGVVVIGSLLWWLLDDDYRTEANGKIEVSNAKLRPLIGPGHAGFILEF